MNKRIEKLSQQATEYYSNGQEREFDREKFAELIVRECIERIKRVGILEDIEIESDMMTNAIKEHFYGAE